MPIDLNMAQARKVAELAQAHQVEQPPPAANPG
jgi:hypothetical protein